MLKIDCNCDFSSVPWPIGSPGGHEGQFSRDPLPVFSAGGPCVQFWHGQGCPLFDVIHQAFTQPTTAPSTFQGALKDGFERLSWCVTCPNHASFCFSTFARRGSYGLTRKLVFLCTQLLVLCSKQEMQRKFLRHWTLKAWILFSESASRVHVSQPYRRMEVPRDLYSDYLHKHVRMFNKYSLKNKIITTHRREVSINTKMFPLWTQQSRHFYIKQLVNILPPNFYSNNLHILMAHQY